MKIHKAVYFVALVIIIAGIDATILIRRGFSTKDQPSVLESVLARTARNLAIPSIAKETKNPYSATPDNVKEGWEHFADHCAICHANDGSGETEMGPNFYPKPPDLRLAQTQNLTDGEIYYIIKNGVRLTGMPGWGAAHTPSETWKLVLLIRHLPRLTPEEKEEMEQLNPKAPDEDETHGE